MKKRLSNIIMVVLFLVCVLCFGEYLYIKSSAEKANNSYEHAREIADENSMNEDLGSEKISEWKEMDVEDDENIVRLSSVDIAALKEINEDVLGWLEIPGTTISYPVMKGIDNDYYLKHTWDKIPSVAGAIFMERLNKEDFSDLHTVIYGHRMNDGSMFGTLKYYEGNEYLKEHPYVYIVDDKDVHRYEIFAVYEAEVGGKAYQIGFKDDHSRQGFIDHCIDMSYVETEIVPTLNDKVLTLSTCTAFGSSEKRFVVQAVLRGK